MNVPAPFGTVRCADRGQPAEVELVTDVNGEQQATRHPLRSDDGWLDRIHARDCASLALAEKVELTLDEQLTPVEAEGEPGLLTVLTVTRRTAQGPVELTAARRSVLYDVRLPDGPALLDADQQSVEVPLMLSMRTCNGHVIGEAKKPYSFLAFLRVGSDEEASAAILTSPAQQARLLAFLDEACVQTDDG